MVISLYLHLYPVAPIPIFWYQSAVTRQIVSGFKIMGLSRLEQKGANMSCLLERMVHVGQGGGQAGKRRRWAALEEESLASGWPGEEIWPIDVLKI